MFNLVILTYFSISGPGSGLYNASVRNVHDK